MSIGESMQQRAEQFRNRYTAVKEQIGKVIVGHDDIVHGVLTCLFVGGHCLLEGVPGLGKTLLVRTLAEALDLRLQPHPVHARPDAGRHHRHEHDQRRRPTGQRVFEFQRGPIFTQIGLADEINRATPKTQSALLEAMQEHRSPSAGTIHELKEPFFVHGDAEPDRAGRHLSAARGPARPLLLQAGRRLLAAARSWRRSSTARRGAMAIEPEKVMDGAEILQWQQLVREVIVAPHVQDYVVRLVLATHPRGTVRRADHEPVPPLGRQPPRRADAGAGRQGAGPARRPLQRQLRGRPPRLPAGAAAPRDPANFEAQAEGIDPDQVLLEILEKLPEKASEERHRCGR